MKKTFSWARYPVAAWQQGALEELRPPEGLSVSQWAERYRVLNERSAARPGPWHNNVTPYLVEIMDAFSDYRTEKIIFVKPTQVGGTTAMENMLGYLIAQDPSPTLVVYPSDVLAESTSENRLTPMLLDCPKLAERFHAKGSTKLELQFDTMYVALTGANSPSSLASRPVRYLFLDEVDKFPAAGQREADPVSLATERTKTFFNRKIFLCSTPTLKTGMIWQEKEGADVEKHYFVPCPHCGAFIELVMEQLKFPTKEECPDLAERAERALYACQECGCVITDRDKEGMLRGGRWQNVRAKTDRPLSVAFWLNTLYSPFVRFSEVAREKIRSSHDTDLLHNFVNSWLAEPWEDTKLQTSENLVIKRRTELDRFVVPEWARMLTGGVDVQRNCLYWTIRAWGVGITSQNISHGRALTFAGVEQVMNQLYQRVDGTQFRVDLALVDSGDQTDLVYDFCAANTDWALPCKGTPTKNTHYTLSTVNRAGAKACGMTLVLVDGGRYKDMIAGRMLRENGSGSWMVYRDCDLEYAKQVTAEQKVEEKHVQRWKLKAAHAANHYLDAEVYAMCAADLLGVRTLAPEEAVTEAEPTESPDGADTPDTSWLAHTENWLS